MINLTEQQKKAISLASDSVKKNRLFRLGGYAGTGKTTVAKYIKEELSKLRAIPCAFTGKAALKLKEKGIYNAKTIHSSIYSYDKQNDEFIIKNEVEGDYFIIDEASMIGENLWKDIQKFNLPVILIGDPGQLEPLYDDPKLMSNPDLVLHEIHRQARENGIIQFATDIRLKNSLKDKYENVKFKEYADIEDLKSADIVICGFNNTRCKINNYLRKAKGFEGLLNKGEQIVILKNNTHAGVFNGQILTVDEIVEEKENKIIVNCSGIGIEPLRLQLDKFQFGKEKIADSSLFRMNRKIVFADYGYCITCHKSQGSEWDRILVIDEQCSAWNSTRWKYTAVTRASKELTYCKSNKIRLDKS